MHFRSIALALVLSACAGAVVAATTMPPMASFDTSVAGQGRLQKAGRLPPQRPDAPHLRGDDPASPCRRRLPGA